MSQFRSGGGPTVQIGFTIGNDQRHGIIQTERVCHGLKRFRKATSVLYLPLAASD